MNITSSTLLNLSPCLLISCCFAAYAHPNEHDIEHITVTETSSKQAGSKIVKPLLESAASITVIATEQLQKQNIVDVEQLATALHGITVTGVSNTSPSLLSRGFEIDSYLIDGVPSTALLQSPYPMADLFFFESVELLRGPSAIFSGFGNPGGVLNLVRKRPKGGFAMQASAQMGSFNANRLELDISTDWNSTSSLQSRFGVMRQRKDEFYDAVDFARDMVFITNQYELNHNTVLTFGHRFDNYQPNIQTGVPGYQSGGFIAFKRSTYLGAKWNRIESNTRESFIQLTHHLQHDIKANVSLQYGSTDALQKYAYMGRGAITPQNPTIALIPYFGRHDAQTATLDLNLSSQFELFNRNHDWLLGADYQTNKTHTAYGRGKVRPTIHAFEPDHNLPELDIPLQGIDDYRIDQKGLYGQIQWQLHDQIAVVNGMRVSWWQDDYQVQFPQPAPAEYTEFSAETSPSVAVVYTPDAQWTWYSSYSDMMTPSSQRKADQSLLPPLLSKQLEVGVKSSVLGEAVLVSSALYQIDQQNRAIRDPDHEGFFLAAGSVRSRGAELEIQGDITTQWQVSAGYSYNHNTYLKDDTKSGETYQPVAPKQQVKIWTDYEFTQPTLLGLNVGLGLTMMGKAAGNGVQQGGYSLLNLNAGYTLAQNWQLSFNINNVLDKNYYARIGGTGRGNYFGAPANAQLTLRASF